MGGSFMSRLKKSIIIAFAFTVLTGAEAGEIKPQSFSVFFPSAAVSVKENDSKSDTPGGITVIGDKSDVKFGFRLWEILRDIFD